ncbi:MAG TPA: hypothetical protein VM597_12090 [Gemmataceae bacterium]|jgi:hypothetical protein|nr:hypothetical protein [Gemmataceae bacterium]
MRRKLFGLTALAVGLLVVTGQSSAQPDPEVMKLFRPVMRVLGSNPAALLNNAGVQKELKLDEEQVKAVGEMNKTAGFGFGGGGFGKGKQDPEAMERIQKMMEKMGQLKDVPEDKLEDKIREVFKEELEGPAKAAEKILKPEQSKRLKQISLQNAGLRGITSADAADLKLSDDQKSKIKSIATELDKDVAELSPMGKGGFGGGGGGRVSPETREKIANLRKEAMEKATEVLTADQKTKWKEMTGEPFEVKFEFARPKKKDD